MLRRLYDWTMDLAGHRHALAALAVVAFVDNGGEGAVTAGPVVKQVLEAYFELKSIDVARLP